MQDHHKLCPLRPIDLQAFGNHHHGGLNRVVDPRHKANRHGAFRGCPECFPPRERSRAGLADLQEPARRLDIAEGVKLPKFQRDRDGLMKDRNISRQVGDDMTGERVDRLLEGLGTSRELCSILGGDHDSRRFLEARRRILCFGHGIHKENEKECPEPF